MLTAFASRWKYQKDLCFNIRAGATVNLKVQDGFSVSPIALDSIFRYSWLPSDSRSHAPLLRFVSKTQEMICARQKDRRLHRGRFRSVAIQRPACLFTHLSVLFLTYNDNDDDACSCLLPQQPNKRMIFEVLVLGTLHARKYTMYSTLFRGIIPT